MRPIKTFPAFLREKNANVALLFTLTMIPIMLMFGAAIDFSGALVTRSRLQSALDAAVLTGVTQSVALRDNVANNLLSASMANSATLGYSTNFFTTGDGSFSGSATEPVATAFLRIADIDTVTVSATATAALAPPTQRACIIGEANGMAITQTAFNLSGAPNMNLDGCGVQSDASMNCDGHGGEATISMAVGTVSGCTNPDSSAPYFSDIYKPLASNITQSCGSSNSGITWTAGTIPATGPDFFSIEKNGYTEYHVCGSLTLAGSGSLIPTGESAVIVVENGDINVSNNATIQASPATFILTGANSGSHTLNFPNGNGQIGSLTLSPPTDPSNPWHGISLYVDPALTAGVNDTLGPGATLTFDGIAYMPNTNMTLKGNTSSGAGACSELVTNSFGTDGSASIAFQQSLSACNALNVPQAWIPYLKS